MTNRIATCILLIMGMTITQVSFAGATIQGATTSLVDGLVNISTWLSILCLVGAVILGVSGNISGALLGVGAAVMVMLAPVIVSSLFEVGTQIPDKVTAATTQDAPTSLKIFLFVLLIILALIAFRLASLWRSERADYLNELLRSAREEVSVWATEREELLDGIRSRIESVPEEPEIPSIEQLQGVPEQQQDRNVDVAVQRNKRKVVL